VQKTEVQQFKVEARDVIDEGKVVAALERYIQDHRPEPTVAIALKTHRPEIDGENIVLAVDNQLQQDKLEALKMHLRNVLMKLALSPCHLSYSTIRIRQKKKNYSLPEKNSSIL